MNEHARPPGIYYIPADELLGRVDELMRLGWTLQALSNVMRGEPGGLIHLNPTIRADRFDEYMARLKDPGPMPERSPFGRRYNNGEAFKGRVTYEDRPTLAPESLDNFQRRFLAERKRRYLAERLALNEAKRRANLERMEQR